MSFPFLVFLLKKSLVMKLTPQRGKVDFLVDAPNNSVRRKIVIRRQLVTNEPSTQLHNFRSKFQGIVRYLMEGEERREEGDMMRCHSVTIGG